MPGNAITDYELRTDCGFRIVRPVAYAKLGRWLGLGLAIAVALLSAFTPLHAIQSPRAMVSDSVRVVYWPADSGMAVRTIRAATTPMRLPGFGVERPVRAATIFLAPDPARFDSLTGGQAPEWSAGVAVPDLDMIVLPAYPSARTTARDPIVALRHELLHLALHERLGSGVPRWFDEGYATWASGEWDSSAGWQIRLALLRGVAPPLDSLSLRWPESEPRARLAYLLAASAVEYLATQSGEDAFAAFLRRWSASGSIDDALRATYLTTFDRFERDWRTMVRTRYGWLLAIAQVGFFWAIMSVLFLVVAGRRKRRDRAKLLAMVRAESLEPPPEEGEVEEWRAEEQPDEDAVDEEPRDR